MIEVICAGDAVRFVPGKQHQHGASAATAMTRVAIDDHLAGKAVDWMEQVGDDESYGLTHVLRLDRRRPKKRAPAHVRGGDVRGNLMPKALTIPASGRSTGG